MFGLLFFLLLDNSVLSLALLDFLCTSFLATAASDHLYDARVQKRPKVDHKVQDANPDQEVSHLLSRPRALDEVVQNQNHAVIGKKDHQLVTELQAVLPTFSVDLEVD